MRRMRILPARRFGHARRALEPVDFWEQRAPDLVHGYDHPETWPERGWMAGGFEEEFVPELLRKYEIASVLVVGAGTGRQYGFLTDLGVAIRGFDISEGAISRAIS